MMSQTAPRQQQTDRIAALKESLTKEKKQRPVQLIQRVLFTHDSFLYLHTVPLHKQHNEHYGKHLHQQDPSQPTL